MLFSVFRQSPRYYSKNFYKQIGLSPHFTLRGFFLRVQRRYPTLYRFTKFTFIFMSIATTSMILLQGTSLPLQKEIKQTAIRGVERFGRLWYLGESQNSNGQNIISYIDFIYQIIWYAFDNGLENSQILPYYLSLVNDAVEKSMTNVKKSSHRCSISINQISSSIVLLNKLFYSINNSQTTNLKKQSLQILKNEHFLFEYSCIINNIVESGNRQAFEIEEKYKKPYKNLFTIFQYLLKFQRPEQKIRILEKMDKLLSQKTFKFMSDALVEGEDSIKSELKKLYRENESYQVLILSIIKRVEQNRRQREEKQNKK